MDDPKPFNMELAQKLIASPKFQLPFYMQKAAVETIDDLRARLAEVEAERDALRRFVEKAERLFRHYGDLHAAKPDQIKAIRNYDLADEARQALGAKP